MLHTVRAIKFAVGAYIVTMIIGMILNPIMGIDMDDPLNIPTKFRMISTVLMALVTILFTHFYFKPADVVPSDKHGLYFGLVLLVTGFVLDAIFIWLYLASGDANPDINPREIYQNKRFFIMVIVMLLTATGVGHYKAHH